MNRRRFAPPALCAIDLDGTLVDTLPDLAFCLNETLASLGLDRAGIDDARRWIGGGAEDFVARALTARGAGGDTAVLARARDTFLALYAEHTCERSKLYPGVREAIRLLRDRGSGLACITNKAARFTDGLLAALDIASEFDLVVSGDTLPAKKPDPAPLLFAARQLGVEPRESLLIGDSVTDIAAAQAAGFSIICVTYGYNHGSDLRQARPDAVIDSLSELEELLMQPG